MIAWLNKRVKKIDTGDIVLIKGASITGALFIITIWTAAMTWVHSVNPWYFFVATLVFGVRPFYRFYMK